MSLTLRSAPADLARQLQKLGVPSQALGNPEALKKTLPPEAKKLLETLTGFSKEELGAVRDAMSGHAAAARKAEAFAPRAGVGGAGVNRFALQAAFEKPGKSADALPKDVQALVDHYLPGIDVPGRPFGRLLSCAAKIDTLLRADANPSKLVDVLSEHDARRNVFQLEGFLKLYQGRFGDVAKEHLGTVKTLEDALGGYSVARSITELAKKQGAPAAVLKELKNTEMKARGHLQDVVEQDWMPQGKNDKSPALKDILKGMAKEDWGSYKKDHKFIESAVGDHLHKMETRHYDMRQLDTGIHELRRHMRWVPLYIEALDGMVQLSETHNPVPALRSALDTPMASNKNAQLAVSDREPEPIRLSKATYVSYLQAVEDLGQIKDRGEQMNCLAKAYVDSGVSPSDAEARTAVARLLGKQPADFELEGDARKIYEKMRDVGLLHALRKDFLDG